ncbi:MAG: DUF3368 domain-containing protein [Saprospiraceae bacterium]|nr:DUF3368 domain-containing protein [Saprospiraceae bacterium]
MIKPVIEDLKMIAGFYISDKIYKKVLEEADE